MKEVVIISGKGGVGKTIVSSSISYLLNKQGIKLVVADADVDTPSLHIVLQLAKVLSTKEIYLSKKAYIDVTNCINCHQCINICPYGAIKLEQGLPKVITYMCEGCGACKIVCPANAITIKQARTGVLTEGYIRYGYPIITAQLEVGEHNSGLLVNVVRSRAREIAKSIDASLILIDGPPGIGCPVISSVVGVNYVIVITEPTPEALKGALRAVKIARHFQVPTGAIINKYDISSYTRVVEEKLGNIGVNIIGKIPFDNVVIDALANCIPVVEAYPDSRVSKAIEDVVKTIANIWM